MESPAKKNKTMLENILELLMIATNTAMIVLGKIKEKQPTKKPKKNNGRKPNTITYDNNGTNVLNNNIASSYGTK